jgi:hypothetical protein
MHFSTPLQFLLVGQNLSHLKHCRTREKKGSKPSLIFSMYTNFGKFIFRITIITGSVSIHSGYPPFIPLLFSVDTYATFALRLIYYVLFPISTLTIYYLKHLFQYRQAINLCFFKYELFNPSLTAGREANVISNTVLVIGVARSLVLTDFHNSLHSSSVISGLLLSSRSRGV